jgi:hypothetical protein
MKVVLDTNILFRTKHRLLYGVDIEVLTRAHTKTPIAIVVPEVVRLELTNLYRRSFREELAAFERHSRSLQALLGETKVHAQCSLDENAAVARYEQLLVERLASLNAVRPDYGSIPHNVIIERCMAARKPFKPSGGYRDTLVWETVVREVAGPDHVTVLITDNSRDFADPKGKNKLHADLVADLDARGLNPDSVRLCSSIEEFNKQYVLPDLEFLERVAEELGSDQGTVKLGDFISEHYDSAMERARERAVLDDNIVSARLGESAVGVRVVELDWNVWEEGALDVRRLDDNHIVADLPASHFCEIEFLIEREAAQRLSRRRLIDIKDMDWNDTMVHASAVVTVLFSLQVILESERLSCVAWDLSSVVLEHIWIQDDVGGQYI